MERQWVPATALTKASRAGMGPAIRTGAGGSRGERSRQLAFVADRCFPYPDSTANDLVSSVTTYRRVRSYSRARERVRQPSRGIVDHGDRHGGAGGPTADAHRR